MPLERISKGFKDISLSLQVSPLNYDILAINNENAIVIINNVFHLDSIRFMFVYFSLLVNSVLTSSQYTL
jgi:hypothetical protein